MKKINLGKLFMCVVLIINILACTPAVLASESGINVLYDASGDSADIGTITNVVGTWVTDPADSNNEAYQLMLDDSSQVTSTAKYFRANLAPAESSTWGNTHTYSEQAKDMGITLDDSKLMIYDMRFRISSDQVNNILKTASGSDQKYFSLAPKIAATSGYASSSPVHYDVTMYRNPSDDIKVGAYYNDANNLTITTDTWHTYRALLDFKNKKYTLYIDGNVISTKSNWFATAGNTFDGLLFGGIEIFDRTTGKSPTNCIIPVENGFLFDDIKVYQTDSAFDVSYSFDKTTSKGTINFTTPVASVNAIDSKIVFKDAANEILERNITLSSDKKTATVVFEDTLEKGITYTLTVSKDILDEYNQYMIAGEDKTFDFSLGEALRKDAINSFWDIPTANYSSSYTEVDDPAGIHTGKVSTNKGSKTVSIRKVYGDLVSNYSAYSEDKQIIESVEFYIPSDVLVNNPTYEFKFNGGDGAQAASGWGMGRTKLSVSNGAVVATELAINGTVVTNGGSMNISTDTWHTLTYVYKPFANYACTYIDETLLSKTTSDNLTHRISSTGTTSGGSALNHFDGIRIAVTDAVGDKNNLYLANMKLYQMQNPVGIKNIDFDAATGTCAVELNTTTTLSALKNALKLKCGSEDVTNLITDVALSDNGYMATVTLNNDEITYGETYSFVLPANYTDLNLQYAHEEVSADFTLPLSKSVYELSHNIVSAPGADGFSVDVTFANSSAETKNVYAVVAVYGNFNLLLGVKPIAFDIGEENVTKSFVIEGDYSSANFARLFIWDSESSMKPYQKCVPLWSK